MGRRRRGCIRGSRHVEPEPPSKSNFRIVPAVSGQNFREACFGLHGIAVGARCHVAVDKPCGPIRNLGRWILLSRKAGSRSRSGCWRDLASPEASAWLSRSRSAIPRPSEVRTPATDACNPRNQDGIPRWRPATRSPQKTTKPQLRTTSEVSTAGQGSGEAPPEILVVSGPQGASCLAIPQSVRNTSPE